MRRFQVARRAVLLATTAALTFSACAVGSTGSTDLSKDSVTLRFTWWGADARQKAGDPALDFPPGLFVDGKPYSLADCRGKAVVLFFYESQCPRCKGAIPERNAVVKDVGCA